MKIILKKDVENLGFKSDKLDVKPGYARNYLIPKGLAVIATYGEIKNLNEIIKQRSNKERFLIEKSKEIEKKLKKLIIKIPVKVSKEGKLFGSINSQYIMKFLKTKGIYIDKKFIKIPENKIIKSLGKYKFNICLHREHEFSLDFEILSDSS